MLDFQRIKEIRLTDVCAKYGIALTFGGKYAKAKCPLPTHKDGDKDKNFNINLDGNFWKCWSGSCNDKAGAKGGDTINFVALMENCSQHEAAKKLSEWFHVWAGAETAVGAEIGVQQKTAQPIATRSIKQPSLKGTESNRTVPSVEVKGYMVEVDAWFDELIGRQKDESDAEFWHRVRNGFKSKLVESFRSGKRVAQGLPAKS